MTFYFGYFILVYKIKYLFTYIYKQITFVYACEKTISDIYYSALKAI